MNKLILLRGCPGSGKTSFLRRNELLEYTISNDEIRLLAGCPVMDIDGDFYISQSNEGIVSEIMFSALERRMKKGETIILDSCIQGAEKMKMIRKLSNEYRYKVYLYEMPTSLEEALDRNESRIWEVTYVKPQIVKNIYKAIKEEVRPSYINVIKDEDELLNKVLSFNKIDLTNEFSHIKIVGDIHGNISPLMSAVSEFKDGADLSELPQVIFVGDYCDRGVNNRKVIELLLDIKEKFPSNIQFLKGNHETHLELWANTEHRDYDSVKFKNIGFKECTIPELEEGLDDRGVYELKKRVRKTILNNMRIYSYFRFGSKDYFISHAGIPGFCPIKGDLYYRSNDLIKGIGGYSINLPEIYKENSTIETVEYPIQVHGHRNTSTDMEWCISLENSVEYGGDLLTYEIYKNHFDNKVVGYENHDEIEVNVKSSNGKSIRLTKNVETNKLLLDEDIIVKEYGDILSLGFSREAFKKKRWNSRTIKARGLFVDKHTGEICLRSYDKFFNLDELKETKLENLKKTLVYPVTVSKKENGFLGILSVKDGEFVFASKSSLTSDHANLFKEIFYEKISERDQSLLKSILSREQSCVFEVCDSKNDPHVYDYESRNLYLLDFFMNAYTNSEAALFHKHLTTINRVFLSYENSKIEFVEVVGNAKNEEELLTYINEARNAKGFEGYVFTDANGYMFKVKGNEYLKYKSMFASMLKNNPDIVKDRPLCKLVPELINKRK